MLGIDNHSACWRRNGPLGLEVALNMDTQSTLIFAGITECERAIKSLEGSHGFDARDGQLLNSLCHGSKHAIVALVNHFPEDLFVLPLYGVSNIA